MKILLVNTFDIFSGAANATYRLHNALLEAGIDSYMLVQSKKSDDYTVIGHDSKIEKFINILRPEIDWLPVKYYKNRKTSLYRFSPSYLPFSNIVKKINKINPDLVHLNWIEGGFARIEDLTKINKPIIWTLHDMWAFTGGCHYDEGCEAYVNKCGKCKLLGSKNNNDLSRKIFNRKQKVYSKMRNFTIIALSCWLKECIKKSKLMNSKKVVNLPNLINANVFKPFDIKKSRELWNLPFDKKLVLFGASDATGDSRKGFKELSKALNLLKDRSDIELVVFGSSEPENAANFGIKTRYLGRIYDDASLVALYNMANVVIVPSLQENLSNVIMESLSCGTPVVAFEIGGNTDMIEHLKNGYLAKPFNADDLASGVKWIIDNPNYDELRKNAREKVINEFESKIVVKKYIDLYEEALRLSYPHL